MKLVHCGPVGITESAKSGAASHPRSDALTTVGPAIQSQTPTNVGRESPARGSGQTVPSSWHVARLTQLLLETS